MTLSSRFPLASKFRWLLIATMGCALALGFAGGLAPVVGRPSSDQGARSLSLEERVAAQKAAEEVLWRHRIWPQENPEPKPPLGEVLSDASIREKVIDYLKKSNALEKLWNRPITAQQLQAEVARIAKNTRQPGVLRELFASLHDDPFLIAECLARPALSDRLLHTAYARDGRFHKGIREQARRDLTGFATPSGWRSAGGRYVETTWRLGTEERTEPSSEARYLSPAGYQALLSELATRIDPSTSRHGSPAPSLSLGRTGQLREDDDSFSVTAILQQDRDSIRVATVVWDKVPFDTWWSETRGFLSEVLVAPDHIYSPVQVLSASCVDNTWRPTGASRPAARYYHSAVWTGTEMIVWGGRTGNGVVTSSGGRYDPVLDLWTDTFDDRNPSHIPEGRERHQAVWTGTRMIVWGGRGAGGTGPLRNGGLYDPATDNWDLNMGATAIDPPGTDGSTAIWTGSEMILWGGTTNYGTPVNTGSRFDPSTRTWTPTSVGPGAPSPRS